MHTHTPLAQWSNLVSVSCSKACFDMQTQGTTQWVLASTAHSHCSGEGEGTHPTRVWTQVYKMQTCSLTAMLKSQACCYGSPKRILSRSEGTPLHWPFMTFHLAHDVRPGNSHYSVCIIIWLIVPVCLSHGERSKSEGKSNNVTQQQKN